MNSSVRSLTEGQWIEIRGEEVAHVHLSDAAVFCVANPSAERAQCLVWSKEHLQTRPSDLQDLLAKTLSEIGVNRSQWILKCIFPDNPDFKNQGEPLLSASGWLDAKVANYAEPSEGFFFAKSGRVKLGPTLKKTRVLIVDDSRTMQQILVQVLKSHPDMEVVGTVDLPSQLEAAILQTRPDVITLDIHMPEMDGVSLLKKYLPKYRIPTVMISALSREDSNWVLQALEAGAVDYIEKPSLSELDAASKIICERVLTASKARIATYREATISAGQFSSAALSGSHVIALGASTGGTEALREVLTQLPAQIPPIVIAQHIPPIFSAAFANRLQSLCPFEVKEAQDGDLIQPNRVLIAPGGFQMGVEIKDSVARVRVVDAPPVNRHKPSVDYLFSSVAKVYGSRAVGGLLTGMGADGAQGLLEMKQAGSPTLAQNEASCVVFGMPKAAIRLQATEHVLPLNEIARALTRWVGKPR